jgi:hypothetical protein
MLAEHMRRVLESASSLFDDEGPIGVDKSVFSTVISGDAPGAVELANGKRMGTMAELGGRAH